MMPTFPPKLYEMRLPPEHYVPPQLLRSLRCKSVVSCFSKQCMLLELTRLELLLIIPMVSAQTTTATTRSSVAATSRPQTRSA